MSKTAIVTGGSRGIGAAIVSFLAKEGYWTKCYSIAKELG